MQTDFLWLDALNPEQKQAVQTIAGPVLVLSGAGTGKTTVLTNRLRYIIETGAALPFQCLAVTFTNKAAAEMKERLVSFIGDDAHRLFLGTFHRLCMNILRAYPEKAGLQNKNFVILDAADQERLLKQVLSDKGIDLDDNPVSSIAEQIQRLKEQALTPEKALSAPKLIREIYADYQTRLQTMNAVDFGDLLLYCYELLNNNPDILQGFQNRFKYILVDEYQDTNVIQYLWLRLLAGKHRNLCCVGDDDQSIYSWRGADVGNILRFEKDYPDATVVRLESNYRSTAHILGAASGLIAHNGERLAKTLRVAPNRDGTGDKVTVSEYFNDKEEADKICQKIEDLQRKDASLKDCAVLIRTAAQSRVIEDSFRMHGLPYVVIGGQKFYDREEIRDAIAYARYFVHPRDDMAFMRIVNKPKRKIGDATVDAIRKEAANRRASLSETAAAMLQKDGIKGAAKKGLTEFLALFDRLRETYANDDPADAVRAVLEESGYMQMRRADQEPNAAGRLENIGELLGEIKERGEPLESYLDYVSLKMDSDQKTTDDCVSLMTLHAAKGLEFDNVFLPGWEEGLFPHQRSLDEGGNKSLEEERRLAYVGLTRAKKRLFVSHVFQRFLFGDISQRMPSRFLSELPEEHVAHDFGLRSYAKSTFFNDKYTNSDYSYQSGKRSAAKTNAVFQPSGFKTGATVYHQTFGTGKVVGVMGQSVSVMFDSGEMKKVMTDYLEKI